MDILGIETSCDETSASVVRDGRLMLSNVIASQAHLHAKTGGVVPEVAARHHVEQINAVIAEALSEAGITFSDIGAVAVANRPGLLGALLVGVSAAKAMAYALDVPLLAIHHIEAHIYANWLVDPDITFPCVCLVVSGGHTEIFLLRGHGDYEILGRTRDDAAGEAFDKSARLLGFPYPGGIAIDRLSREGGNPSAVALPRAWLGRHPESTPINGMTGRPAAKRPSRTKSGAAEDSSGINPEAIWPSAGKESFDFSFSGLKTAVATAVRDPRNAHVSREDWAASVQEAIVDVLVGKAIAAAKVHGVDRILMAGGVAANTRLQARMVEACTHAGIRLTCPPPALCTDNAAMIACAGYYHWQAGKIDSLDIDTYSTERLA